jgi:hemerythrin-like domain-containing protein
MLAVFGRRHRGHDARRLAGILDPDQCLAGELTGSLAKCRRKGGAFGHARAVPLIEAMVNDGRISTMPQPIDMLRREHANAATLLRTLEWQVAAFRNDSLPDYEVIRATLDYFGSFPDICHHPKEDLIFARLRQRDPAAAERIGDLRKAHEQLAVRLRDAAAGMRAVLDEVEVSRDAVVRWATDFIDQQRQHINMEESAFFPEAERILTAKDWSDLTAQMTKADDPLFGAHVSARFEQLRQTILAWQAEDETASAARQRHQPSR